MSQPTTKLPAGIHLSAVSTQNFELVTGVGQKTGRPYRKIVGRGVAGEKFVKITEFVEDGHTPILFNAGDHFEADVTGVDSFEKGREVVSLFVKLRRPIVAEVKK
jgi:hypothetical protein